jgi:hypothetical protein
MMSLQIGTLKEEEPTLCTEQAHPQTLPHPILQQPLQSPPLKTHMSPLQPGSSQTDTRKRLREDPCPVDTHKDDVHKSESWIATAREQSSPIAQTHPISWNLPLQQRTLLHDPDSYPKTQAQIESEENTRLPSIKHLHLDAGALETPRPRTHWEYYSPHPYQESHSISPPHFSSSPHYSTPVFSPTQHPRSPLNVTQTITPPAPPPPTPQIMATELVPVKSNTYGFIETTFTTMPVKKVHFPFTFSNKEHWLGARIVKKSVRKDKICIFHSYYP